MYKSGKKSSSSSKALMLEQQNLYSGLEGLNIYKTNGRPKRPKKSHEVKRAEKINRLTEKEMRVPKSDGSYPTYQEALDQVLEKNQNKRWYQGASTRRSGTIYQSAEKSKTTGWTVRKYIGATNTVSLSGLFSSPAGAVAMQADGIWNVRNLDPTGAFTGMTGTITFVVNDRGQPDVFSLQFTTAAGVQTISQNTDPTGNVINPNVITITIPLESLVSPIIMFSAIPADPTVAAVNSNYDLTITVNGTATLGSSVTSYGVDGVSNDPSKVKKLNKDYLNDGVVNKRTNIKLKKNEKLQKKRLEESKKRKADDIVKRAKEKERISKARKRYLARGKRQIARRDFWRNFWD